MVKKIQKFGDKDSKKFGKQQLSIQLKTRSTH